jgi:hypothetical protein
MNSKISDVHNEVSRLRIAVATDSAMLLSILRLLSPKQLSEASRDFLQACESLHIRTLYSELDEGTYEEALSRRDWWVGLIAELIAKNAGLSVDDPLTKK